MRRVTRFLILAGVSTLAACASQAPTTSTKAAATSATAHPSPDGYTREVVNGYEEFCRDDPDTGSRVQRTKVCLTWEQLQAQERSQLSIVDQRTSPQD